MELRHDSLDEVRHRLSLLLFAQPDGVHNFGLLCQYVCPRLNYWVDKFRLLPVLWVVVTKPNAEAAESCPELAKRQVLAAGKNFYRRHTVVELARRRSPLHLCPLLLRHRNLFVRLAVVLEHLGQRVCPAQDWEVYYCYFAHDGAHLLELLWVTHSCGVRGIATHFSLQLNQ